MATTIGKRDWTFEPINLNVRAASIEGTMVALGRILFSLIFILSGFRHFLPQTVEYATQMGLSGAAFFVPASGLLIIIGGLSILLGYHARLGGLALVFFLIPTTLIMHRFWGLEDSAMAAMQQAHFMKNLALLGGALLICYYGSSPVSADSALARKEKSVAGK